MVKRLLSFVFFFPLFTHFLSAQQCESSIFSLSTAIPDNSGFGVSANLPVAFQGTLGVNYVLDSVHIDINHTYVGDILVMLVNPAGDSIMLFDRPGTTPATGGFGCGNDNVNATFSNYSNIFAENLCNTPVAINGSLKPVDTLSLIQNGPMAGNWKIFAADFAGADIGTIFGVSLYFKPLWYQDLDQDNYGSGTPIRACSQPLNYVPINGDCDDTDANVYPGGTEICGNKIDEDCSGEDTDYLYQPLLSTIENNGFCEGDSALILISPFVSGDTVIWYHDNVMVPSSTGNYFYASEAGNYTATIIMTNGCNYLPNILQITENPLPQPTINLTGNGLSTQNYNTYTWLLDGQEIIGGNDKDFMPTINGTYQVEVTDANGCKGISAPFEVLNASVNENDANLLFNCYPNPATNYVNIYTNNSENTVIEISNVQGKSVFKTTTSIFPIRIETSEFASGIYLVKVGNQMTKLVVRK